MDRVYIAPLGGTSPHTPVSGLAWPHLVSFAVLSILVVSTLGVLNTEYNLAAVDGVASI